MKPTKRMKSAVANREHKKEKEKYCIFNTDSESLSFVDSLQFKATKELNDTAKSYEYDLKQAKKKVVKIDHLVQSFTIDYINPVVENNIMYEKVVLEIPQDIRGNSSGNSMFFSIKDVIGDGNCGWYSLADQEFFDYSRIPNPYMVYVKKTWQQNKKNSTLDTISQHRLAVKELIQLYFQGRKGVKGEPNIKPDDDFRAILRHHFSLDEYLFHPDSNNDTGLESQDDIDIDAKVKSELRQKIATVSENRIFFELSVLNAMSYIFRQNVTVVPIGGGLDMSNTICALKKIIVDKIGPFDSINQTRSEDIKSFNNHLQTRQSPYQKKADDILFQEEKTIYIAHVFDEFPFDNYLLDCPGIEGYGNTEEPKHFNSLKLLSDSDISEKRNNCLFIKSYGNMTLSEKTMCLSLLCKEKFEDGQMLGIIDYDTINKDPKYIYNKEKASGLGVKKNGNNDSSTESSADQNENENINKSTNIGKEEEVNSNNCFNDMESSKDTETNKKPPENKPVLQANTENQLSTAREVTLEPSKTKNVKTSIDGKDNDHSLDIAVNEKRSSITQEDTNSRKRPRETSMSEDTLSNKSSTKNSSNSLNLSDIPYFKDHGNSGKDAREVMDVDIEPSKEPPSFQLGDKMSITETSVINKDKDVQPANTSTKVNDSFPENRIAQIDQDARKDATEATGEDNEKSKEVLLDRVGDQMSSTVSSSINTGKVVQSTNTSTKVNDSLLENRVTQLEQDVRELREQLDTSNKILKKLQNELNKSKEFEKSTMGRKQSTMLPGETSSPRDPCTEITEQPRLDMTRVKTKVYSNTPKPVPSSPATKTDKTSGSTSKSSYLSREVWQYICEDYFRNEKSIQQVSQLQPFKDKHPELSNKTLSTIHKQLKEYQKRLSQNITGPVPKSKKRDRRGKYPKLDERLYERYINHRNAGNSNGAVFAFKEEAKAIFNSLKTEEETKGVMKDATLVIDSRWVQLFKKRKSIGNDNSNAT